MARFMRLLFLILAFSILIGSTRISGSDRQQFTYKITSVLKLLPPVRISDMNDDFQSARLIKMEGESYVVEVTYYPLDHPKEIGENANWKAEDSKMTEYLKPRPSANWDNRMRLDLIAELKKDGIDPDKLTDRELVQRVSQWVLRRCRYADEFNAWYVYFPNGSPKVYPELRRQFDAGKPNKTWSDRRMFENEILGKEMFYNKVHGQCTSSAILMTTILRALGIPTRMVIFIPPADGSDAKQKDLLLKAIHHNVIRNIIETGMPNGGFADHMFNEVYINHQWVRLNYDKLGQEIVDRNYMGLMTHIYTFNDLSELPLAKTWGMRYANYDSHGNSYTLLSSVNPYMLLKASDQFGKSIDNPAVSEIQTLTIGSLHWLDAAQWGIKNNDTRLLGGIVKLSPGQTYGDLRLFWRRAPNRFLLRAPGHSDVSALLQGSLHSSDDAEAVIGITTPEVKKMVAGVDYHLIPVESSGKYTWKTDDSAHIMIAPNSDEHR